MKSNPTKLLIIWMLLMVVTTSSGFLLAQNPKVFYIGHSLSDQIPDMVKSLSDDDSGVDFNWRYQWIPGAPLGWQWDRKEMQDYNPIPPHYIGFYDLDEGLPAGGFDVLVLTESVPRNWTSIGDTYRFADSFFVYANQFNPGLRVFIYEIWHCLDSGTPTGCDYDTNSNPWRQRLTDNLAMWESVVDTLNARFSPADPVCLIPAGQGLAALYDSIQVGVVPGIDHIEDLFSDRIHLNDVGKYFVACIHFAAIHQQSPVGLTNQLQVWWGGDFQAPSQDLALKFQQMAWETVTRYPKNCLGATPVFDFVGAVERLRLSPNPATDYLTFDYPGSEQAWSLFDQSGRPIQSGTGRQVGLKGLPPGVYFVQVGRFFGRFVKRY